MDIYEKINSLIKQKGFSKKEFAQRLILLEPKSHRTGEVMSIQSVYTYLSGKTVITADIIPYICEVLNIPEQLLFDTSSHTKELLLKNLFQSPSSKEELLIKEIILNSTSTEINLKFMELLSYAPKPMIDKIRNSLIEIKKITTNL